MKTILTKLIYSAVAVIGLASGVVTANGSPGDLFASINGGSGNGVGSINQYKVTGLSRTVASGLSRPRGVALNSRGNLFVATNTYDPASDTFQATILKITPRGVQTVATLNSNLFAGKVVFDQAGNLFVTALDESDPNFALTIYKITPGGVVSTFASLPDAGGGLAFDNAGNLFTTVEPSDGPAQILKFLPDGTASVFVTVSSPEYHFDGDLAFDRFGNLFASVAVDQAGSDLILQYTPDGAEITFATGLTTPRGLAFDRDGNLFVAEVPPTTAGDILKFAANGNRTLFAVVPGGGNSGPEYLMIQR